MEIETQRLLLRRWREADKATFGEMNRDPRVLEFLIGPLSQEESDQMVDRIEEEFEEKGFGLWAVSVKDGADFIGFIGLHKVGFDAHFTPAIEIGWRLAYDYWGKGYAAEGAKAVLEVAFNQLGLEELVSFTAKANLRSQRVMEKIGMVHDPADDFNYPNLPEGDRLSRHVLFRKVKSSDST